MSDRGRLLLTGVNGPLMARRPEGSSWRPSAFQAGRIPSWRGSCGRCALPLFAAVSRWSLLLVSRLLSGAAGGTGAWL